MKGTALLLLGLCLPMASFAAPDVDHHTASGNEASPVSKQQDWGGALLIAPEIRGVRNSDGSDTSLNFFNVAGGVRYKNLNFLLEFAASDTVTTGNLTLNVQTKMQDVMGWILWNSSESIYRISPLLGGGIGAYQTKVTTALSGVSTEDESPWKLLGGVSAGIKLDMPIVWVSIEGRLLFGDELSPQPTLSGLARVGIGF